MKIIDINKCRYLGIGSKIKQKQHRVERENDESIKGISEKRLQINISVSKSNGDDRDKEKKRTINIIVIRTNLS